MIIAIGNYIGRNSGGSKISKLIKDFKTRVALDGGIFEAESCLNTTLTNLNNIS